MKVHILPKNNRREHLSQFISKFHDQKSGYTMIELLLLFTFCEANIDNDLPFVDDDTEEIVFPKKEETIENKKPSSVDNFKFLLNAPKKPLNQILGWRECVAFSILMVYILFYVSGLKSIRNAKNMLLEKFFRPFGNYFYFVPEKLTRRSLHECDIYLTGRTEYVGGLITITFSKRADIIGYLIDKILKHKTTVEVDLILKPSSTLSGFYLVNKEAPKFSSILKLSEYSLDTQRLKCFSDLDELSDDFNKMVNDFEADRPNVLKMLELTDTNRYSLRNCGTFSTHFEFEIKKIEEFDETVTNFIVNISDLFVRAQNNTEIMNKNKRIRDHLVSPSGN